MSQENVEIVRRIFEGWATGDFGVGVAAFDPQVMIVVPPGFPEPGVYVGAEGIREFTRRFLAPYERVTIEATALRVAGAKVLADVVQAGKRRSSGLDMRGHVLHARPVLISFTLRGRKIVRMESVLDKADALKAARLSE